MRRRIRTLLRALAFAALAYLLVVLLVFLGQMAKGAFGDADADLVGQSLEPALTETIGSVRTIVAANRTPVYQRDAHAKPHGCVRAVFEVPEAQEGFRYGVFSRPGRYDAWVRFSNGTVPSLADTEKDARGMAIKLMGVSGPQLLDPRLAGDTQDFVMINSPQLLRAATRRLCRTRAPVRE